MRVKRFYATSVRDAMREVRKELGADAVILKTRQLPKNAAIPLANGRATIEIVAAAGAPEPGTPPYRSPFELGERVSRTDEILRHLEKIQKQQRLGQLSTTPGASLRDSFGSSVASSFPANDAAPVVTQPVMPHDTPLYAHQIRDRLCEQGIEDILVRRILERMPFSGNGGRSARTPCGTFGQFVEVIGGFVPRPIAVAPAPGRGTRKIALAGPTGVGKTTTVAKMASYYALKRALRVGLVTMDTFRIGAVEQLRTYAKLLGAPLRAVPADGNLKEALDHFGNLDLVLIDTPGHSPRDSAAIRRQSEAFEQNPDVEVHFMIAASTREEEIRSAIENFKPLGLDRLIFSKLDEAGRWGALLNTWVMSGFDVSYFTTGQRVPEDLEAASIEFLCRRLVINPEKEDADGSGLNIAKHDRRTLRKSRARHTRSLYQQR